MACCYYAGLQVDIHTPPVTSRQEMGDFYQAIATGGDLSASRVMKGWRREALGEPLVELVGGGTRLSLAWADGTLKWDAQA